MASSSYLILIAISSLLLVLSSHLTLAQPTAPAPSPPGPLNFTGILDKAGGYTMFIRLLTQTTQVAKQIDNQLNTSTQGLTVFAPTDNAFNNLKSGTLNDLTPQQQVELLLYHVLPQYYTIPDLLSVSNPVRTQANDGLNFTGQANQLNVSTGLVETQIYNAVYQKPPLAIYQVDKVLLPPALFGATSPTSSPPSPSATSSGSSNTTSSTKTPSSAESSNSGAEGKNLRMGLIVGVMSMCVGVLF